MTRRLYIECGAAETRAAYFIDDEPVRFWFAPARGDEHLTRPAETGELFIGRVKRVSKSLNSAFVDIGESDDGFLRGDKGQPLPVEGARQIVVVRRPAIAAKGAVLSAHWRENLSEAQQAAIELRARDGEAPARLSEPRDAALSAFAARKTLEIDEIIVNDADAASVLRSCSGLPGVSGNAITIGDFSFRALGVDDAIEDALDRLVALPEGARLIFDETEAMTVVDVDSGAAGANRPNAANDRVNAAAAKVLFRELARRGAGGRIVVDFLTPSNAGARAALLAALTMAGKSVFPARIGKLSVDGIFDLTAERGQASLLDRASEPAGGADWLRSGRRLRLDWGAKAAVRALEQRLRGAPSARLALSVGKGIEAHLSGRPQWRERIAARFGARFDIVENPDFEERAFDVVERR